MTVSEIPLVDYYAEVNADHGKAKVKLFEVCSFGVDVYRVNVWAIPFYVIDP